VREALLPGLNWTGFWTGLSYITVGRACVISVFVRAYVCKHQVEFSLCDGKCFLSEMESRHKVKSASIQC